jgi:5,10-methylene-tetrahydrofolate dehydrogenase/methenyl tetrahydrofolate cyclohydrolase
VRHGFRWSEDLQNCIDFPPAEGLLPAKAINNRKQTMGKRVLVTGGAGFLGDHLCAVLLNEGCQVLFVDNFFTSTRENVNDDF